MTITPDGVSAAGAGELTLGGDLTVRRMGFGAMRITGEGIWGEPPDPEAARALLRHAVELDVNLIDTADSYGPEVSESLIAEALHPYPDELLIATKGGLLRDGPGKWRPDCRPERLKQACEASLRRLRLDTIDLYQLHAPDPKVPLEESVGALADLRTEGKVRHIGLSNVSTGQLVRARGMVPIVSVQNRYSVTSRDSEEILEACARDGLGFIPWFPLDTGSLAGRTGAVSEVAAARGALPTQVALAWLLQHAPVMLPIPGTSSATHLEQNVAAATLRLDQQELDMLSSLGR